MESSEQGDVPSSGVETSSSVAAAWAEYMGPGAHSYVNGTVGTRGLLLQFIPIFSL